MYRHHQRKSKNYPQRKEEGSLISDHLFLSSIYSQYKYLCHLLVVFLLSGLCVKPLSIDSDQLAGLFFLYICLSDHHCYGFQVKIKLWNINVPWNGKTHFRQLTAGLDSKSSVFPVVHWVWVMMNPVLTPRGELSIHYQDHLMAIISRPH